MKRGTVIERVMFLDPIDRSGGVQLIVTLGPLLTHSLSMSELKGQPGGGDCPANPVDVDPSNI